MFQAATVSLCLSHVEQPKKTFILGNAFFFFFFFLGGGGGRARLESTDKLAIPQDDCDSGELICTKNQVLDDLHISSVFLISSLLFSVISCTMPSLEVGTVGGGTVLGPQSACLKVTFFF